MYNMIALTAAGFFTGVGYFLLAMLCLMFMIVIHELGHFIVGRALGFKIDEFAVGFGPAIFKYKSKKSNVLYALRCIPLGGYCAFAGEQDGEEIGAAGSFNSHAPWKRIIVFIAGALFNLISAIIIISIFFMAYGDFAPNITNVYEGESGDNQVIALNVDDVVLEVNGKSLYCILNQSDFVNQLNKSGDSAELTIVRDGAKQKITVNKRSYMFTDDKGETSVKEGFGISYNMTRHKYGFFGAIGRAFVFIFKAIGTLFATIGGVFTGALGVKESLGGTATAIGALMQMTATSFDAAMYAICMLSATLAVTNLLPIPALDGSKVVFTTIEWVRGKPINRKVENTIHMVGLFLLLALTITLDIIHFI